MEGSSALGQGWMTERHTDREFPRNLMSWHLTFSTQQGYIPRAVLEGSQRSGRLYCRPMTVAPVGEKIMAYSFMWVSLVERVDLCYVVAWKDKVAIVSCKPSLLINGLRN